MKNCYTTATTTTTATATPRAVERVVPDEVRPRPYRRCLSAWEGRRVDCSRRGSVPPLFHADVILPPSRAQLRSRLDRKGWVRSPSLGYGEDVDDTGSASRGLFHFCFRSPLRSSPCSNVDSSGGKVVLIFATFDPNRPKSLCITHIISEFIYPHIHIFEFNDLARCYSAYALVPCGVRDALCSSMLKYLG